MREFDSLGLKLATFQGDIFERSVDRLNCSSPIFMRRFKYSDYAYKLDNANENELLDPEYAFDEINSQFKETSYGQTKYQKEVMFWVGYMYRYISYTREITTKKAFSIFDVSKLISNYYVYHTQSEEWVISRLLDDIGKDESIFDKNVSLKRILKVLYSA